MLNSKLLDKLDALQAKCFPLLFSDNKFITDFKEKSEISNSFFAKQCSLIDNKSTYRHSFLWS